MGTVTVRGIGKAYRRYAHKWGRLAEWVGLPARHDLKWAVRDISFDVSPGEAVGIIGLNGAGKSTLLKIITGTTRPTEGEVVVGGRVAALLELGIGFHPEFTGRENVYMAGQLRGLGKNDIDAMIDGIEAFAGIGDYLDQPLRTYSSGMQVRLAFSVATAVRPEILIVDEALSVGDILFQQKCFDRIRGFQAQGTTLLFVSHALPTVYALCSRCLLIRDGRLALDGTPRAAIDLYNALVLQARDTAGTLSVAGSQAFSPAAQDSPPDATPRGDDASSDVAQAVAQDGTAVGSYGRQDADVTRVQLLCEGEPVDAFVSESTVTLAVTARFHRAVDDPHVGFQIRDHRGEALFATNTHCMGRSIGAVDAGDEIVVRFAFRAAFAAGDYSVTAGIAEGGMLHGNFRAPLTRVHDVLAFTVLQNFESILWSGVYNVAPTCAIDRAVTSRGPSGS